MIRMRSTVCIEAPTSSVWECLTSLEEIPRWSAPILSATCPAGRNGGVGATRVCTLRGNLQIRELWTEWSDEQRYFKYEAEGIPLVKHAANRWSVQPQGQTQSLLVSEAEIELRGGIVARLLLEPVMEKRMTVMGRQSLAALKYLIETGREYQGDYASLPMPKVVC
ncbi:MAG: SRPBCC family protein [Methylococcaceae bacterium]|nr:SRPBCC family protein [Methylococcaceae bacterium]